MIGHWSDSYAGVAEQLGARYFSVANWPWAANEAFLEKIVSSGGTFGLVTPLDSVRTGSTLEREIDYLKNKGYKVGCNGTQLLPPQ